MLYNHSTEPNAMFAKDDDDNLMHYVALRPIAKGEEITQDISTLENPAILEQLKQAL